MSTDLILTDHTIGITDFKASPGEALKSAGEAVAVLSHNRPVGYFVTPKLFAAMRAAFEALEDGEDMKLVAERWKAEHRRAVRVNLADL